MSGNDLSTIHGLTEGGLSGTHPEPLPLSALVAPTHGSQHNTIRASILPLACWKMEDIRFDFDSSMILPELRADLPLLAELIVKHTNAARVPPLSIFGHADPVGDDKFNKSLSGRRAAAVYGMLTRRDEVWEDLYSNTEKFASSAAGDVWGIRSIQIQLNALPADLPPQPADPAESGPESAAPSNGDGFPNGMDPTDDLDPEPPDPPDPDKKLIEEPLAVNGVLDDKTRAAVKRFQSSTRGQAVGLAVDGDPGPRTRSALFLAYMDVLCVNAAGTPFKVDPEKGFIGGGKDAAGKCDFQGCSEFNPLLVFSKDETKEFDSATEKTLRNIANEINRRVLVLLFRPGLTVSKAWPCPRANEGPGGCRTRFWSDGEQRRSPSDQRREFADTLDTFACRFYQRMTTGSPCEKNTPNDRIPIKLQIHDAFYEPCRNEAFLATGSGGFFERGKTDSDGMLTIKVPRGLERVVIRYTPSKLGIEYSVTATLVQPEGKDDATLLTHLRNLGFGKSDKTVVSSVVKFQAAHGELELTGKLDAPTKEALNKLLAGDLEPELGSSLG